jgi:hypothetical protein
MNTVANAPLDPQSRLRETSQGPDRQSRPWLKVISCCTCNRGDRTGSQVLGCKRGHHICSRWIYSGRIRFLSCAEQYPGRVLGVQVLHMRVEELGSPAHAGALGWRLSPRFIQLQWLHHAVAIRSGRVARWQRRLRRASPRPPRRPRRARGSRSGQDARRAGLTPSTVRHCWRR